MMDWKRVSLCSGAILVGTVSTGRADSFQGIGDLDGGAIQSFATDVSADGSTVVGTSNATGSVDQAVLWTADGGIESLGSIPGTADPRSRAEAVSDDGSVITGFGIGPSGGFEGFESTGPGSIVSLGNGDGALITDSITADGSMIVGTTGTTDNSDDMRVVTWTQATGLVDLGRGANGDTSAGGVSADGSVIVGSDGRFATEEGIDAVRWTQATGFVALGHLPGGDKFARAFGVSADGTVAVGESDSNFGQQAFRWTEADGMVGLGDLTGGPFDSRATDASGSGSVIVGESSTASGPRAFIWDADNGIRNLRDVLAGQGLIPADWTLLRATAISDDGTTIVGNGSNAAATDEGWVARLDVGQWANTSSGDWSDPDNWNLGIAPKPEFNVEITPEFGLTVHGPTTTATVQDLTIGAQQAGDAILQLNGGTIEAEGIVTIESSGKLTGNGTLLAVSANEGQFAVDNRGEIVMGSNGQLITSGSLLNTGVIRGQGSITGEILNSVNGQIRIQDGDLLQVNGIVSSGQINLLGGTLESTGRGISNVGLIEGGSQVNGRGVVMAPTLTNSGKMSFSGGFMDIFAQTVNSLGASIRIEGASITTFFEDTVNNGQITVAQDSKAVFIGPASGAGAFPGAGVVEFHDIYDPGLSPGRIDFGGDVLFTSNAQLKIEVGGQSGPGAIPDGHDLLVIADQALLDGTISVELINGFSPSIGEVFTVVAAGEIVGGFETIAGDVFILDDDLALVPVVDEEASQVALVATYPGDANLDFQVDAVDLNAIALNWQKTDKGWQDGNFTDTDTNIVDAVDLNVVALHWQFGVVDTPGPGALVSFEDAWAAALALSVPEPGTMTLLGVTLVGVPTRRR